MKFAIAFSTLVGLGMTSALPRVHELVTRGGPSDTSGNSQFILQCQGTTVPDPISGSGTSYWGDNLLLDAQGTKVQPTKCTQLDGYCVSCDFEGNGLSSTTSVTGCWDPPGGAAGCNIKFSYGGTDYVTTTDEMPGGGSGTVPASCGVSNNFSPFSSDLSAICYFNI